MFGTAHFGFLILSFVSRRQLHGKVHGDMEL
jgi:hypothetical protein